MGDMHIDELKQRIRAKRVPPGTKVSVADRRRGMEAVAFSAAPDVAVEVVDVRGCSAEWLRAGEITTEKAILYCHGGGYVMGSPNTHRSLGGEISRAARAAVLMLDYRLAPEAAFPAAVDDAVGAYEWLLAAGYPPESLAIAGDSAGGGLAVATLLALRDKKVPMPAGAVCISPWSDLTCTNDSYRSRAEADPMVEPDSIAEMARHYLQGADPASPLASPNLANLHALPPLLIHVGRDEVLLDDAVKLHERAEAAGIDATLEIRDDMVHVWHAFHPVLPEAREGIEKVGAFLRARWGTT